jgi:hypothetical protein
MLVGHVGRMFSWVWPIVRLIHLLDEAGTDSENLSRYHCEQLCIHVFVKRWCLPTSTRYRWYRFFWLQIHPLVTEFHTLGRQTAENDSNQGNLFRVSKFGNRGVL